MIFLTTALKSEANPLIQYFNMKQESGNGSFRLFSSGEIKLIVSGTGGISSAIATTFLLTKYNAKKTDILFNIGLSACNFTDPGSKNHVGNMFIINSVKNQIGDRNYYPDMILKTSLPEASLITLDRIWRKNNPDYEFDDNILIDMEGAYIYEAALKFLYSHNVFILKVISDFGYSETFSGEFADKLIREKSGEIAKLIFKTIEWSEYINSANKNYDNDEFIKEISQMLMLTGYQIIELKKLYRLYCVRNYNVNRSDDDGTVDKIIKKLVLNHGRFKEKKEGKIIYEKIRRILSE